MLITVILSLCIIILTIFLIKLNLKTKWCYASYTIVPYRLPIIGHLMEFINDANKFIFENSKKYGSVFTANIFGQRITFLLDFRDLHTLNKNPNLVFSGTELVCDVFGSRRIPKDINDIVVEKLYKTIYPKTLQQSDALNELVSRFLQHFHRKLNKDRLNLNNEWHECGLLKFCRQLIFEASTHSLFGDIEGHDLEELEENFFIFQENFHIFFRRLPQWFYKLFYQREYQARQKVIELLTKEKTNESEFIKTIREEYQYKYKDIYSSTDIGAHMMIFFFASVANVIPATFWILYYLLTSQNRQAFQNIREEIIIHNGEMDKLKLVDSVINEALRLTGSIFLMRCTYKTDGTTLDLHDGRQLHIYPKDLICYYPTVSHYDETIFLESNVFKYDRFIHLEKIPPSYMPFGNGKSMCPGRFFVRNEMKITLITLIKEMDLELVDFQDDNAPKFRKECVGSGVLLPDRDIKIRYRYKNE